MSLTILQELFRVIEDRRDHPKPGSYVSKLMLEGVEKISKKIEEEATELIEATRTCDERALIQEAADLIFHVLVLLAFKRASLGDVLAELRRRRKERKSS